MKRRRTIVVVTERRLFPVNDGTRARIVTLIRGLRALGFRVVLVARRPAGLLARALTRWLADRLVVVDAPGFLPGTPSAYDCTPFHGPLRSAVERFSPVAVIAEYVWMAPSLHVVRKGVLRMVDTIDLMHARGAFSDRVSNIWVTCTADEERHLLRTADTVIAIQTNELDRFRQLLPDRDVICVPHHVPVRRTFPHARRAVVMLVGSSNPCNVEGLMSFLESAWPVVQAACPDAELRIFGELARVAPERPGVVRRGYTASLERAYRDAAVVINPVRTGTGLKIKTVEALAHGRAIVTTTCGAEGLEGVAGRALVIEDDPGRFGHAVVALLRNPQARITLERAAARIAEEEFSRERVYAGLLQALAGADRGTDSMAARTLRTADWW
jgi:glycosyltransferase involved in cell wall biosynthesis